MVMENATNICSDKTVVALRSDGAELPTMLSFELDSHPRMAEVSSKSLSLESSESSLKPLSVISKSVDTIMETLLSSSSFSSFSCDGGVDAHVGRSYSVPTTLHCSKPMMSPSPIPLLPPSPGILLRRSPMAKRKQRKSQSSSSFVSSRSSLSLSDAMSMSPLSALCALSGAADVVEQDEMETASNLLALDKRRCDASSQNMFGAKGRLQTSPSRLVAASRLAHPAEMVGYVPVAIPISLPISPRSAAFDEKLELLGFSSPVQRGRKRKQGNADGHDESYGPPVPMPQSEGPTSQQKQQQKSPLQEKQISRRSSRFPSSSQPSEEEDGMAGARNDWRQRIQCSIAAASADKGEEEEEQNEWERECKLNLSLGPLSEVCRSLSIAADCEADADGADTGDCNSVSTCTECTDLEASSASDGMSPKFNSLSVNIFSGPNWHSMIFYC